MTNYMVIFAACQDSLVILFEKFAFKYYNAIMQTVDYR
jgi:hypothetical protein